MTGLCKLKADFWTKEFTNFSPGAHNTVPIHDWWETALKLEAAEKLAEAEVLIRDALSPRGEPWTAQSAHLYELRCRRLLREGRRAEAQAAFERGCKLMKSYASGATSGGEGLALSQEAEDYRRELAQLFQTP